MNEATSAALPGKVKRVLGIFIIMIAAGIILDSPATWVGTAGICVGAIMFAWGMTEAQPRAGAEDTCLSESPHSPTYPTERSL